MIWKTNRVAQVGLVASGLVRNVLSGSLHDECGI